MFICFHNKFSPVNCMHYINCDVNSSLLKYFWLLQKVCGTLDHSFITIRTIHNGATYTFTLVWYSAKQCTTHRSTSHLAHLYTYTVSFLWSRVEHRRLRSLVDDFAGHYCMAALESHNMLWPRLVFQSIWGQGDLGFFPASSIKFLTRNSLKSLWVCLAPQEGNRI
jgi:hypothetical protein